MNKEPIKHHYIPRFLLKPFCDEGSYLYFYDKKKQIVRYSNITEVFMERNLYRDEYNQIEDPVQIEKDFARFENEVSGIVKKSVSA